jgi:hypothetical protein
MMNAVATSHTSRLDHYQKQHDAKKREPYPVPQSIIKFGRMAEPALARIMSLTSDAIIQREAATLVKQLESM